MRSLDFTPLYRSTVGFDRLFGLLDAALQSEDAGAGTSYPPYNIEATGEDSYRITMAVAGFSRDEITVEVKQNSLSIVGKRETNGEHTQYLHRGIAGRAFDRRFELADHVKVVGATLENGLLHVDLKREVPEEAKPRKIEIANGGKAKTIETKVDKAA